MDSKQLEGTLFIGFPKTMPYSNAETIFDEISDYIDNNEDISLKILQSDSDYYQLTFQQTPPNTEEKVNFFFLEMEIYISNLIGQEKQHKSFVNILRVHFGDVCELLRNSGYTYNDENDFWYKNI